MTTTERNAATLREIRDTYRHHEFLELFDLLAECVTRYEKNLTAHGRLNRLVELIGDQVLTTSDIEWLKTQAGIEA